MLPLNAIKSLALVSYLILGACASQNPKGLSRYPAIYELDVPEVSFFSRDREPTDGFATPQVCVNSFMREAFKMDCKRYVFSDNKFCRKYFSASLRHQIAASCNQYEKRRTDIKPEHPGLGHSAADGTIGIILNAWDLPTSYRVVDSQVCTIYCDRGTSNRYAYEKAVVDVIYIWGLGRQYEGNERCTSVILVKEDGRWFISDLYTHGGPYESAYSFYVGLLR